MAFYKGTNVNARIDENRSISYKLDDENDIMIEVEQKVGERETDWSRIEPASLQDLKIFSDEIANGKYRIEIGGRTENYLKINGADAQMDTVDNYRWDEQTQTDVKDGTREVYILKQSDIVNNKITIGAGLYHKFSINPGQDGRTTVAEDLRSVTWRIGNRIEYKLRRHLIIDNL